MSYNGSWWTSRYITKSANVIAMDLEVHRWDIYNILSYHKCNFTGEEIEQKFMTIAREDIARQTGTKFFVDREVVDKCYSEIRIGRDKTVIDEFLLKHCTSRLTEDESCRIADATQRGTLTMYHLITMGGRYGHHMMYMAMRDDTTYNHERIKSVKLLRKTGMLIGACIGIMYE